MLTKAASSVGGAGGCCGEKCLSQNSLAFYKTALEGSPYKWGSCSDYVRSVKVNMFLTSLGQVEELLDAGSIWLERGVRWMPSREWVEQSDGRRLPTGDQEMGPEGMALWKVSARTLAWRFGEAQPTDLTLLVESLSRPDVGEVAL